MRNSWTGGQYSIFRALFGIYLFVHFVHLAPWAWELFSSQGMLPEAEQSPLLWLFPNIFGLVDSPAFVLVISILAALASLLFAAGVADRWAAFFLWFVLACLYGRNPLIANPSLPYVGWMLLAHLFIPKAPYGSLAARGRPDPGGGWRFPRLIFLAAWIVLALSYSYSGYSKLLSPSWVSGDAVAYVLGNPLARDYFLRDFFLWLPPILVQVITWAILYIELLFAPAALLRRARPWLWSAMLLVQFGFAFLLNFADLTIAMLLFHLFTFDPGWVRARKLPEKATLFYDGTCALCHGICRLILAEDTAGRIRLSPLQSEHFESQLTSLERADLPDSIVLMSDDGLLLEADATIRILKMLGGLWLLLALLMSIFPARMRTMGYHFVGDRRYRIFGRTATACPIVPPHLRSRFKQ